MNWTQYKFRFNDDPLDPSWWMDLFLIDTAFREVIEKHKPELWRFHRRSGKDSVGHQLSLLVYIGSDNMIFGEMILHNSVKLLQGQGHIKSTSIELMEPGTETTSDPSWSDSLQKSWPYFACGSCQMIMGLLGNDYQWKKRKLADDKEYATVDEIREYYNAMHDELKDSYTDNAAHVFIHHLSALFGYAPIKLNI